MISAAGLLLLSKSGRALFLKRGNGGDCPGTWCFPGGRLEVAETALDAAIRETDEETGGKARIARDNAILWTRSTNHRETTGAAPSPVSGLPEASLVDPATLPPPAMPGTANVVPGEQVDFTTYIVKDVEEFEPDVDKFGECVAFAWAPIDQPPEPLHPGCRIAITRFTMNELDVANTMIEGQLTSPQRYGAFSLFNIRITGTGIAFRARKLGDKATRKDKGKPTVGGYLIEREEEYPVRDPAHYLTPEFLERCNGLPVVLEHPGGQRVDSKEFNNRTIGTVFKPYIRDDEVWAIAKIYDEDAIELMTEHQLSTSPGVVFTNIASLGTEAVVDGKKFLFEGKPSLMDHIAVCRQGVWDKGGPPVGVETILARKDAIDMDKEELIKLLEANKQETNTAIGTALAAVESLAGSVTKIVARMDAEDETKEKSAKDKARKDAEGFKFGERKDSEDEKAFKDRRDAEETALCDMYKACGDSDEDAKEKAAKDRKDAEEEEEKAAKDRKDADDKDEKDRKDSETGKTIEELRKEIEMLKGRTPEVQPRDADSAAFGAAQQRFDDVYVPLGRKTPVPMQGESLLNYRRRALLGIKDVSKKYKDVELGVVANDAATFNLVEGGMLEEVGTIARTDASVPAGTLREITKTLPTGHRETTFLGATADWFTEFSTGRQFAAIQKHNANGRKAGA